MLCFLPYSSNGQLLFLHDPSNWSNLCFIFHSVLVSCGRNSCFLKLVGFARPFYASFLPQRIACSAYVTQILETFPLRCHKDFSFSVIIVLPIFKNFEHVVGQPNSEFFKITQMGSARQALW